jgi:RNA polymerase sigma-B factor
MALEEMRYGFCDQEAELALRRRCLCDLAGCILACSLRPLSKPILVGQIQDRLDRAGCDVIRGEVEEALDDLKSDLVQTDALGRYYSLRSPLGLDEAWHVMSLAEDLIEVLSETTGTEEAVSTEAMCLRDINRCQRLSESEVEHLMRRMRDGDVSARRTLIRSNAKLSVFWARRFMGCGVDLLDLIQVAHIGLIKAVDRFDLRKGFAFSTFASKTIQGEIQRYLRDYSRPIHVSRGLLELSKQLASNTRRLRSELLREPNIDELAASLGVAEDAVYEAMDVSSLEVVSIESESQAHEEIQRRLECGPFLEPEDPDDSILARCCLEGVLERIDDRARVVLFLRFVAGMTQEQIAEQVGVYQVQVSRLLRRSMDSLRMHLEEWPAA